MKIVLVFFCLFFAACDAYASESPAKTPDSTSSLVSLHSLSQSKLTTVTYSGFEIGTSLAITINCRLSETALANAAIQAAIEEIHRINLVMGDHRDDAEVEKINRSAGKEPVVVSPELFKIIDRSVYISSKTDGAFDISFAAMNGVWDYKAKNPKLPDPAIVAERKKLVDWRSIELNPNVSAVYLKKAGMRIGLGGIAKGYCIDRCAGKLSDSGFVNFIVNSGGDLRVSGTDINGKPWPIHVMHPRDRTSILITIPLSNVSIATSGDYERFVMIDGKRYHHIIDPKTGYPAENNMSATAICRDATMADGLATALFIMAPEKAISFVNSIPDLECAIVSADGTLYLSEGLKPNAPVSDAKINGLEDTEKESRKATNP